MAFRNVFSNVTACTWNSLNITGIEDINLTEQASRVSAGADDELHESVQFMGMRTTGISLTLQTPPPFDLPTVNTGTSPMATMFFTVKGRMGSADRNYSIANVQWFNLSTNGAHGALRKWTLSGNAVVSNPGDATPVTHS